MFRIKSGSHLAAFIAAAAFLVAPVLVGSSGSAVAQPPVNMHEKPRVMAPEEIGEPVPKPQKAEKPKQNTVSEMPPEQSGEPPSAEVLADRRPAFQQEEEFLQTFCLAAAGAGFFICFLVWKHYQDPENYAEDGDDDVAGENEPAGAKSENGADGGVESGGAAGGERGANAEADSSGENSDRGAIEPTGTDKLALLAGSKEEQKDNKESKDNENGQATAEQGEVNAEGAEPRQKKGRRENG